MGRRVLVLDPSRAARQFLGRVVRVASEEALPIDEAADLDAARALLGLGTAGVATSGPEAYEMVVADADLAGGACLRLLTELAPYPLHKVVAALGGDDARLRDALRAGADGFLLKDDPQEVWVEQLRRLARGQPALSPAVLRPLMRRFADDRRRAPRPEGPAAARGGKWVPAPPDLQALSPRESEVLTYLSKGFTIREISGLLGIRWFTVNDHIKAIYRKLDVSSRAEAAVLAAKRGLV
jgi:two-component system nitrate/nitrite response regulator NarL